MTANLSRCRSGLLDTECVSLTWASCSLCAEASKLEPFRKALTGYLQLLCLLLNPDGNDWERHARLNLVETQSRNLNYYIVPPAWKGLCLGKEHEAIGYRQLLHTVITNIYTIMLTQQTLYTLFTPYPHMLTTPHTLPLSLIQPFPSLSPLSPLIPTLILPVITR
jgi:hypothetical protein